MMGIVSAAIGIGLFGFIGMFLFLSVLFGKHTPSNTAQLVKNPRFIAGCACVALTALCCIPLL